MGHLVRILRSPSVVGLIGVVVLFFLCSVLFSRNKSLKELDDKVNRLRQLTLIARGRNDKYPHKHHATKGESDMAAKGGFLAASSDIQSNSSTFLIKEYWQASSLIKWDFEKPPEYDCKNKSSAGIYYICQDPAFRIKTPCLAYSFGVYTKWAFEETLGNMGCETHSFDPSVPWDDHIHKKVVHFHKLGIGAEDTDTYEPPIGGMYIKKRQVWKMRTLPSIMKMLGHEGRALDVLKVDVEGWEWPMMEQLLDTGLIKKVRQFVVEWHLIRDFPKKTSYMDLLRTYYRMKEAGFRTFSIDFRFRGFSLRRWRIQSDVMYVNTRFDPS